MRGARGGAPMTKKTRQVAKRAAPAAAKRKPVDEPEPHESTEHHEGDETYPSAADGFAIVSRGVIEIKTVFGTRRGAIVNYLVMVAKVPLPRGLSDEQIDALFAEHRGGARVHLVKVVSEGVEEDAA